MRFVAILGVIVSVVSSAAWADARLQCLEDHYDKDGNHRDVVPQYFILQDGGIFRKATLRWDNKKVDLSLVTNTPTTIEATGKATEYMPPPAQIDQCITKDMLTHPPDDLRDEDHWAKFIKFYHWTECVDSANVSDHEIPIEVNVTINRVTGNLTIRRRQDNNDWHDTEYIGSCKTSEGDVK
jgi:hypothetical protein